MKIRKGFVTKKMGDQTIVVAVGKASKQFNGMIKLNESGEFLWEQMQEEKTQNQLVEALMSRYDVSEEVANKDVEAFIKTLEKPAILE